MTGLLLVDKSSGPTSYDLIRWIKRTIKKNKIGHCGTLDPLASGLMLILIGREATKKQTSLMKQEKVYKCGMRLGLATETGDITGKIVETRPVPAIDKNILDHIQKKFTGSQMQTPPMYSALKKEGVPLYKLARQGKTVERAPRPITIHALDFLKTEGVEWEFRVKCSSGTYVRTLVEDIAKEMGSIATMASLVREKIGNYELGQAISGEELKSMSEDQVLKCLVPLS